MELVGKVSKGTKMDQIYIPKNRSGLSIGSYVVLKPIDIVEKHNPVFYGVDYIEPIKMKIVEQIFDYLSGVDASNIMITGSFLEKGFHFEDVDVLIVAEKCNANYYKGILKNSLGINFHLIVLDEKTLIKGIETDPMYQGMINTCIAKKRLFYRVRNKPNFKILDLHLLKNIDLNTTGREKYKLVRNLIAIQMFIHNRKIQNLNLQIERVFGKGTVENLKNNLVDELFLRKFNRVLKKVQKEVLNEQKQVY